MHSLAIVIIFIVLRKENCFLAVFSFHSQRSVTAAWATPSPWSIVFDACPCSTGTIVTGACLGLPWVRRVEGWPGPEQDEGPGDILQGGHGAEIE